MDEIKPAIEKTNNLVILLLNISNQHYLYISSKSLYKVESFIDGYALAQHFNNIEMEGNKEFKDFFQWTKTKLNYLGNRSFFEMFNDIFKFNTDEERFEIFFEMFKEFLIEINFL